ncbi:hypothetical protein ACLESO_35655 [Pyxidicoccus sp. 3LG]
MTHLMEPALVALPQVSKDTHDEHCVFCKEARAKGETSKLGKENSSQKLETSLKGKGEPRKTYMHAVHGEFSSEPHHLVPGNQALKGHAIEQWLSKSAVDAGASRVKEDTGFDVNSHYNGYWLPSLLERLKAGGWSSSTNPAHMNMAVDVQLQESQQFHKGGHANIVDPDQPEPKKCYIDQTKGLLTNINKHALEWMDGFCEKSKPKAPDKAPPPYYLNDVIYSHASQAMRRHVHSAPATWEYFISKPALEAHKKAKLKRAADAEPEEQRPQKKPRLEE